MIRRLTLIFAIAAIIIDLCCALFLAESTLHPHRKALTSRDADRARELAEQYGAQIAEADIRSADDFVLRGWYFRKAPKAVLLLHGQADNRAGMLPYAGLFLRNGFSVLAPDSRAQGNSQGRFATYGCLEAEDVHRWVNFLVTKQGVTEIYGLGESMGAAILLTSLQTETRFNAVVAESSFCNFSQIAKERIGSTLFAELLIPPALLYTRMRYGVDLARVRPDEAVSNSSTPVFLIHGEEDLSIASHHSRDIARSAHRAVLWIVPNTGHTAAFGAHPAEFEQKVLCFFGVSACVVPTPSASSSHPSFASSWR